MRLPQYNEQWPESWKSSYNYDCEEFFGPIRWLGYHYSYRRRFHVTLELIQKAAPPPARVLDIAAAQGNFSLALADLGYAVTWNDLRDELVDYVKLKREGGDVSFAPGNVFDLGFSSNFDVIVITEIIEHVAHPDEFLKKVATLVRPGGHVVMTTPNGEYFRWRLPKFSECSDPSIYESKQFRPNSDGHIFLLHSDEIQGLAKGAGLKIISQHLFTNSLTNGHVGLHFILPYLPVRVVNSIEDFTHRLPPFLQRRVHNTMAILFQRVP